MVTGTWAIGDFAWGVELQPRQVLGGDDDLRPVVRNARAFVDADAAPRRGDVERRVGVAGVAERDDGVRVEAEMRVDHRQLEHGAVDEERAVAGDTLALLAVAFFLGRAELGGTVAFGAKDRRGRLSSTEIVGDF